jgi:hypothetical protein
VTPEQIAYLVSLVENDLTAGGVLAQPRTDPAKAKLIEQLQEMGLAA